MVNGTSHRSVERAPEQEHGQEDGRHPHSNEDDRDNLVGQGDRERAGGSTVGTSQAAKAASHDRILDIAAARIRRDGIDSLSVAELMKGAGPTHGWRSWAFRHTQE